MTPSTESAAASTAWSLAGRRAIVTGATKGIGRAAAEELLRLDAAVLAVARTAADVDAEVAAWRRAGLERAHGLTADATRDDGIDAILAAARSRLGGLDVLVLNVGTNVRKAATEYERGEFQELFRTNVDGAFELARRAHPLLRAGRDPAVVMVGSVAGDVAVGSGAPYAATKAALSMLVRALASEWGPDGIRVNAVAPWYIDTPLVQPVLQRPGVVDKIRERTPLGRTGDPAEVARAIAFLALPAASYVSGQTLAVDGGFLARGW
ncbi:MAG: SDR family oxidoreductase [Planctomycetota bacterium]